MGLGECHPREDELLEQDRRGALLFDEGEELGSIAAALGHTSVDTTKRVYAHLLPKRARATASRIDAALGRRLEVETG